MHETWCWVMSVWDCTKTLLMQYSIKFEQTRDSIFNGAEGKEQVFSSCFHEGYLVFWTLMSMGNCPRFSLDLPTIILEWSKRFQASALQFVHPHSELEPASSRAEGKIKPAFWLLLRYVEYL